MLRPELYQYSSRFQQPQKNRNRRQRSSGQWRVMPSSQRDVSARRRCPENLSQLVLPPVLSRHTDVNPDPQIPKRTRQVLRGEQEDSIQKRQKTELTMERVHSGNDTATLTKYQKALHTAKQKELLNMDKFGMVEVVDRPQSQQGLSARNANCVTKI